MMKKPLIGIIDISINNILSIKRALEYIGFDVIIINEQIDAKKFDVFTHIKHICKEYIIFLNISLSSEHLYVYFLCQTFNGSILYI